MRPSRTPLTLALTAALTLSPAHATAAPAVQEAPPGTGTAFLLNTPPAPDAPSALDTLVDLSAERLGTAETVAAAKWHTGAPIEDPAREEQVLDSAREEAVRSATDPEHAAAVVRDQIEAHKTVQHALHARWSARPGQAPTEEPDLGEVRPALDRITSGLVRELADTEHERARADCPARLARSADRYVRDQGADTAASATPHTGLALVRALASVCL